MDQLGSFTAELVKTINSITPSDLRPIEATAFLVLEICRCPFTYELLVPRDLVKRMLSAILTVSKKGSEVAQTLCTKALCSFSSCLGCLSDEERIGVAGLLQTLLYAKSKLAVMHAVGGIYSMVEQHLCDREILSACFISKIVEIALQGEANIRMVRVAGSRSTGV
jgi:hypothetical protein